MVHPLTIALSVLLAVPAVAGPAPSVLSANGGSGNVLIIVADDIGVDYVGAYGEGTNPPPTPNIDSLATNGVLFRNAWAYPSCSPTRASVLTGRYPFRTMVGRWILHDANPPTVGLLDAAEQTLPELLDNSASGYAHAMIGKWHLGSSFSAPDDPRIIGGFDHYAGSLEGQIPDYENWTHVVDGVSTATTNYCTIQNTDDALAWIQTQTSPWMCVLTYQAPHIPYHAPPAGLHTQNLAGLTPQSNHTPANIPFYRAMVESIDTEIGRLVSTLGPNVMGATNVIFIGDNGTVQRQSVAPFDGQRAKGTPFEGGINVPLIVTGPAVTQPGREVGALCCAVDVFETALDLAGSTVPPAVQHDSVSLEPYLSSTTQADLRTHAYSEQFTGTAWPAPEQNGFSIIRDDRYKLIHYYSGSSDRLYDLVVDPFENANLIQSGNPLHVQARADLLAEIVQLRATFEDPGFVVFGNSSCIGSNGLTPQISGSGTTSPGSTFSIGLSSAAAFKPVLFAFGTSSQSWSGIPLPLDLAIVGAAPGCILSSSADVVYTHLTDPSGASIRFFQVPNDSSLVGLSRYAAWVVIDAGAPNNPNGYVSTNSVAITIL